MSIHIATYQREIHNGVSVAQHFKNDMPSFDKDVVVRLGGTMPYASYDIQINSMQAVLNSIDKLKQKELLLVANLPTLPMYRQPVFPCVLKGVNRSGGTSVHVCNNTLEFDATQTKIGGKYIIEPLFNTTSEYRLHCTRKHCFFSVKKFKRPEFGDFIIINRDNHYNKMEFPKPRLWKEMQEACVRAMTVLDLDIAAFDVLYDSSDNTEHKFTISEANTNPELLHNTYNAYLKELVVLINEKIELSNSKKVQGLKKAAIPAAIEKPVAKELTAGQKIQLMTAVVNGNYFLEQDGVTVTIKL